MEGAVRTVALLVVFACNPASPEREVAGDEGPAEAAPVSAPGGGPAVASGGAPGGAAGGAAGAEATVAWDRRLIDVLLVHMALTERLATTVASRASPAELRAYAEEERAAARAWRDELGAMRARWYPDAPALTTAPTLADLGPTPGDLPGDEGRSPEDDAALIVWLTDRADQLDGEPIDISVAADTLAPLHRRAIAAAMAGEIRATHPELRDLATRLLHSEQRALQRLTDLVDGGRG